MVCCVTSLGLYGVEGYPVTAECALSGGLPAFDVVGLPDAAVKEVVLWLKQAWIHQKLFEVLLKKRPQTFSLL